MSDADRHARFLAFSVAWTGYSRVELLGTGLVGAYADFVAAQGGELDDEGFARRVTELWYTGTWRPLDGGPAVVVAAEGHAEALVWRTLGVPAPGTRPAGFGSWASEGSGR